MKLEKEFKFFYQLHKKQKYNDGQPYWSHLQRVGIILDNVLSVNKEGTKSTKVNLIISGFGHDSLEDANISLSEIKKQFGDEIAELIFGVTNEEGNSHTKKYIIKICRSEEEIRLIKLADICDNLMRVIYRPEDPKFLKNKVLPIIEPMYQAIIKTNFKKYPKSSKQLKDMAKLLIKTIHSILK